MDKILESHGFETAKKGRSGHMVYKDFKTGIRLFFVNYIVKDHNLIYHIQVRNTVSSLRYGICKNILLSVDDLKNIIDDIEKSNGLSDIENITLNYIPSTDINKIKSYDDYVNIKKITEYLLSSNLNSGFSGFKYKPIAKNEFKAILDRSFKYVEDGGNLIKKNVILYFNGTDSVRTDHEIYATYENDELVSICKETKKYMIK